MGIAGLVVLILSKLGINVVQSDVEQIIAAAVILVGIIHQYISHRNLATITGRR